VGKKDGQVFFARGILKGGKSAVDCRERESGVKKTKKKKNGKQARGFL
jgi:hypothetical protein